MSGSVSRKPSERTDAPPVRPTSVVLFLLGGAWGVWCGWNSPGWEVYGVLGLIPASLFLAYDHLGLSLGGPILWMMTTCGAACAGAPAGPQGWLIHVVLEAALLCLACYWLSRWRRAADETRRMRLVDPLTGFCNREGFLRELRRAAARRGESFAVGVLDLDRFKTVNDRFGHAVGDRVLQRAGRAVAAQLGPADALGRFGGDEFALLLDGADAAAAAAAARKILAALRNLERPPAAEPPSAGSPTEAVTGSLGLVLVRDPNADGDAILHRADELMYRAKRSGRDRFEFEEYSNEVG